MWLMTGRRWVATVENSRNGLELRLPWKQKCGAARTNDGPRRAVAAAICLRLLPSAMSASYSQRAWTTGLVVTASCSHNTSLAGFTRWPTGLAVLPGASDVYVTSESYDRVIYWHARCTRRTPRSTRVLCCTPSGQTSTTANLPRASQVVRDRKGCVRALLSVAAVWMM